MSWCFPRPPRKSRSFCGKRARRECRSPPRGAGYGYVGGETRISDVLQEAKWEADFLVKMQDTDGGFYFLVYPVNREYEGNVTPDHGDPQVVWPKTTSVTAASVAALAQLGSSPAIKRAYPAAASLYRALVLDPAAVLHGERPWTLLTYALVELKKVRAELDELKSATL